MLDKAELGRRVKLERLSKGMTLKQVADASGMSPTHISEIERGRTSPTVGALLRIARALGKSATYFVEEEEQYRILGPPCLGPGHDLFQPLELSHEKRDAVTDGIHHSEAGAEAEWGERERARGDRSTGPGEGDVEPDTSEQ